MKRFRKITAVMLAAVCAALLLTACGGGGSKGTSSIDVSALADELNKDTVKNDTLTETSSDMLSSIYFFIKCWYFYISNIYFFIKCRYFYII